MTDTKEDLARREAPCFIYEKEEIVRRCGLLKAALPDVQFLYSVKANPFDPVVRTIAGEGFGSDAASSDEVQKSIRAGVPIDRIFYSAPGKTDFDIRSSLGFCVFIADSIGEVSRIARSRIKRGSVRKSGSALIRPLGSEARPRLHPNSGSMRNSSRSYSRSSGI